MSEEVKIEMHEIDEDRVLLTAKIFGHDIYRVFRDDKSNIIKIILKKGDEFFEFKNVTRGENSK